MAKSCNSCIEHRAILKSQSTSVFVMSICITKFQQSLKYETISHEDVCYYRAD